MKKRIINTLATLGFVTGVATTTFGQVFIGAPEPQPGESGIFEYWNFNTFAVTDTLLPADFGSGTLSLADWGGTVANFGGNILNAQSGDTAGASLSLQGGVEVDPGVFAGNGTFVQLSFSMENLQGLEITFAVRGTSSGFDSGLWSYSVDGVDFIASGDNTASRATPFSLATVATAGLDGATTAYLRYTLDGATTAFGNNRIDNLTLSATVIPEPGTYALLFGSAILGMVALRRRLRF